jgi:hypothetical protein
MKMDDKWLEGAARRVCELRGIDPDKMVSHGAEPDEFGIVLGVLLHSPAWRLVAREVVAHQQISQALNDTLPAE